MNFLRAAFFSFTVGFLVNPVSSQEISSAFLNVIDMSMKLSTVSFIVQDVIIEETKERMGLDRLEIFQDGSGLTSVSSNLVVKHDEVCYGVFRGTLPLLGGLFQNVDVFPHQVGDSFSTTA